LHGARNKPWLYTIVINENDFGEKFSSQFVHPVHQLIIIIIWQALMTSPFVMFGFRRKDRVHNHKWERLSWSYVSKL